MSRNQTKRKYVAVKASVFFAAKTDVVRTSDFNGLEDEFEQNHETTEG